ncbi:M48 family metallopeptidase [Campylobacter sp. 19-13652]|uniref:M48 family metallopeptidase n=1 Tax=Campylobacter sp. 19-13652 TaxID=2840180 RepID=UPI001C761D93|nr:M48 family metallopeptidase [Campylobacter sp. 19-13652]BCX79162.1 peptidase M48 [Campylobacter sp. 19-13652]
MLLNLIIIFAIYTAFKIALSILQIKFIKAQLREKAVILDEASYHQAGVVADENEKFSIASSLFSFFIFLIWATWGLSALQNALINNTSDITQQTIFVVAFLIMQSILWLPFDIYEKFIKDKRQGFSNINAKLFALDTVKTIALTVIFGGAFVWVLLWIMQKSPNLWWLIGFCFSFGVILMINLIYPTLIAPIFNKMTPLTDSELSSKITELLNRCGFKSSGVFVMDASRRDGRLNAYFGGLGASKRVVLFDTLLLKLENSEILAVLGHELGHFKHKDILKMLALSAFMLFVIFFVFGNMPASVYSALGINSGGGILVFLLLFSSAFSLIFSPIIGAFSRQNEFNADKFGSQMQNKNDMINALKKLGSENKAFPKSHPLYSAIYHSHPSLYERISELSGESS